VSELSDVERAVYEWQIWAPEFGEQGQERLKDAAVLITRCGGLGSVVAYELAAAGVGKLILAHAGNVEPSDLNRQLLMTHESLGTSRVQSARRRLLELNPRLEVEAVEENINEENAAQLVAEADVVVDCAPLFEERFLLNRAIITQRKPMVECAMYDLETHATTIVPGETPCLGCLYPERPPEWKREFPVFGAVSGMVACIGAMEAVKLIAGFGQLLTGQLLVGDLRELNFRKIQISRNPNCPACGHLAFSRLETQPRT